MQAVPDERNDAHHSWSRFEWIAKAVFTAFATLGISDSVRPMHINRLPSLHEGMVAEVVSRSPASQHPVSIPQAPVATIQINDAANKPLPQSF